MAKNNTNKIVWLVIIGLVLAWIIAGFAAGLTHNLLIGVAMFLIIFSGVFGKKPMERVSSFVPAVALVYLIASGSLGDWWKWLISVLVALFVGNALSNFRPDYEKEYASYKHELKYMLTSKEDGFSVSFPKKPQTIDTGDYSRQYISKSKGANHSVTVYDLREARTTKHDMSKEVMYSTSRALDFLEIQATETRSWEGKADINGLPSIQLSAEKANGTIYYFAAVVKGNKLYEVVLNIHSENDELFSEFVNSFKFID